MIHLIIDVKSNIIGSDTKVWQCAVITDFDEIGADFYINCQYLIENNVQIIDRYGQG